MKEDDGRGRRAKPSPSRWREKRERGKKSEEEGRRETSFSGDCEDRDGVDRSGGLLDLD